MRVSDKKDVNVPAEQPAVRKTIVGGRPPGPGKRINLIPLIISIFSFFSITGAANDYLVKCGYDLTKWRPLIEEIKLTDKGRMCGFVLDIDGEPIPYAVVILEYKGVGLGGITVDDGFYYAVDIPVGVYDVKASRFGYEPAVIEDVAIKKGAVTYLSFRLEKSPPDINKITCPIGELKEKLRKEKEGTIIEEGGSSEN